MTPQRIPLLLALITVIGAGVYVAASAPQAALSATWTPPPASGCFVAAEAYLIDWRTMDGRAGRDTTFVPVWTDYPVGTFRFRVAGYSFVRGADGQSVIAWNIGRPSTGTGCAVSAAETLWSAWSGWGSNGSPGQPGAPVFGAVLK
jgi:hypothetical protein